MQKKIAVGYHRLETSFLSAQFQTKEIKVLYTNKSKFIKRKNPKIQRRNYLKS